MEFALNNSLRAFSGGITAMLLAFILLLPAITHAQDYDKALNLYQQQEYERAAELFKRLDTPEGNLFAAKSYFSMGQYLQAQSYLNRINTTVSGAIYREALYTSALINFQLKQFGNALTTLQKLGREELQTDIVAEGEQFYSDILNYLTLSQRRDIFLDISDPVIRYDLIRSSFGKVDFKTAKNLLRQLKKAVPDDTLQVEIRELEKALSDSLKYEIQTAFGNPLQAPRNMIYNIGAALPEYETDDNKFGISRGLYFGYLMAAENFNQAHDDKKVIIRHKNTSEHTDSVRHVMTNFSWEMQVDAILGPLYSEPANTMANLAEQYQIPLLAPLANSDSLNIDNPYVYQANPTFTSHGKKMAEFAVNDLQMDTLAVLAESNSLGAASAYAFRDRAEKLGAKVPYFFVEDLESEGYEITPYSKHFTTDSTLIDSLGYHYLDGVYAPFTGQVAPTLIDLLLIDLEGLDSDLTVLGSQEWGATEIQEDRLGDRTIYFTESYYMNSQSDRLKEFKIAFEKRFGIEPNRFAFIGYDAANFLLQTLGRVENPALLKNALKNQSLYNGLITNIDFDGTHINQEVKVFKLSRQGIYPAKY